VKFDYQSSEKACINMYIHMLLSVGKIEERLPTFFVQEYSILKYSMKC